MTADDDFGGPVADLIPDRDVKPGNLIPFPTMRANSKLAEQWTGELARINNGAPRPYTFKSPLGALDDLIRKRGLPTLPWPAGWAELGKRTKTYVGECVGVVGPTGGGKTSFAIQVAIAARAEGLPVLWNPKELDAPELDLRICANMAGVHTARIREDWTRDQIAHQLAAIDDLWRFVDNLADLESQLEAYRVAIRMAKAIYRRPPVLFIDYIGKLAFGARDPRLAIMYATEAIRQMIAAEECFAFLLAQPSRSNNATLTGKNDMESATDAIGVAGESGEIEHACSVMIGLNVFKVDDSDELDAHVLVTKARGTGREGRQGFRFHKSGGVWRELPYLPPTPNEITEGVKKAKKDKGRVETPTKMSIRQELSLVASSDADTERRRRICGVLAAAGMVGMSHKRITRFAGTGRGHRFDQSIQELERSGDIEKLTTGNWRLVYR